MNKSFSRLESHLQRLIEEGTARIFSAKDMRSTFAARLAERMQAEVQFGEDGQLIAPNIYTIAVSEEDASALETNKSLISELELALRNAASLSPSRRTILSAIPRAWPSRMRTTVPRSSASDAVPATTLCGVSVPREAFIEARSFRSTLSGFRLRHATT